MAANAEKGLCSTGGDGHGGILYLLVQGIPEGVSKFFLRLYLESITGVEVANVELNPATDEAIATLESPLTDLVDVIHRSVEEPLSGKVVNIRKAPFRTFTVVPNEVQLPATANTVQEDEDPVAPDPLPVRDRRPTSPVHDAWIRHDHDTHASPSPDDFDSESSTLELFDLSFGSGGQSEASRAFVTTSFDNDGRRPGVQGNSQANGYGGELTSCTKEPNQQHGDEAWLGTTSSSMIRDFPQDTRYYDYHNEFAQEPPYVEADSPPPAQYAEPSQQAVSSPSAVQVKEVIHIPAEKAGLAPQAIEQRISESTLKRLHIEIAQDNIGIELEGDEDAVKDAKLVAYEVLATLTETPIGIPLQLAKKLQSQTGRDFLAEHNIEAAVNVHGNQAYLLVFSNKKEELAAKFQSLFTEQRLQLTEANQSFVHSAEWKQTKDTLQGDAALVAISSTKDSLVIHGSHTDVQNATSVVRPMLKENATTKQGVPVKKGVGRYLDWHGRGIIGAVEKRCSVKINVQKANSQVEICGHPDNVATAKAELLDEIKQIAYDRKSYNNAGVAIFFESKLGKTILKGTEQDRKCIIETRRDTRAGRKSHPSHSDPPSRPPDSPPDQRSSMSSHVKTHERSDETVLFSQNNVKLLLRKGDLTSCRADALVNTMIGESRDLGQSGSVSKSFLKRGGHQLQQEYNKVASHAGGNCIVTGTGELRNCKFVFHVRLRSWKHERAEGLEKLLKGCLQMASKNGIHSMALPTIGCGGLKYPPDQVLAALRKTLAVSASRFRMRLTVYVMAYGNDMYQQFEAAAGQSTSHRHTRGAATADASAHMPAPSPARPRQQKASVVIHVNAKDATSVRSVLQDIDDHINKFAFEAEVRDSDIKQLTGTDIDKLKKMAHDSSVQMDIDKHHGVVTLSGQSDSVRHLKSQVQKFAKQDPHLAKLSKRKRILHDMAEEKVTIPKYWSKQSGHFTVLGFTVKGKKGKLVEVKGQMEKEVESLVYDSWRDGVVGQGKDAANLSHKRLRVTKVERIENPDLWYDYCGKKKKLLATAVWTDDIKMVKGTLGQKAVLTTTLKTRALDELVVSEINEVFLFHGTGPDIISSIVKQGLDSRLGDQGGMFGKGIYFAESSTKADQYTDSPSARRNGGDHHIFVTRVLLGRAFVAKSPHPYQRAPCTHCKADKCSHQDFYDSVIGTHKDMAMAGYAMPMVAGATAGGSTPLLFREFVVYGKGQTYPEFLVTYQRK